MICLFTNIGVTKEKNAVIGAVIISQPAVRFQYRFFEVPIPRLMSMQDAIGQLVVITIPSDAHVNYIVYQSPDECERYV